MITPSIPRELEAHATAQFDALVAKGEILWAETDELKIEQHPFDVYFRISPITLSKPYNPASRSRKPGFQDDDPDFEICHVAPAHKLILNKYCWLRPQLILHTREFRSQRDVLDAADFEATVAVLTGMGSRYMVVFNGGPDAGSSVAHKHLQVFPRPGWETVCDAMVRGGLDLVLPFVYRFSRLQGGLDAERVGALYEGMCRQLGIVGGVAHSVMLTDQWLMVIPRTCATIQGGIEDALIQGGANAMIGIEWLKTPEQFENWRAYGPMRVLREFGVRDGRYTVGSGESGE